MVHVDAAALFPPILFKLVLSVADGVLRCKCGRPTKVHVKPKLLHEAKHLQPEYGHVVIMTAYSF